MLTTACRNETFHGYHSKIWPIIYMTTMTTKTKKTGICHFIEDADSILLCWFVSSVIICINLISDYDWLKDCQSSINFHSICLFRIGITFHIYYSNPIYSNSLKCIAFKYDLHTHRQEHTSARTPHYCSIWHLLLANFPFNQFPFKRDIHMLVAILTFSLVAHYFYAVHLSYWSKYMWRGDVSV